MNETDVVAVLCACLILLLWFPRSSVGAQSKNLSPRSVDSLVVLSNLLSQTATSLTFIEAWESVTTQSIDDCVSLSSQQKQRLTMTQRLSEDYGLSAHHLIDHVLLETSQHNKQISVWNEKSAPAVTGSTVLIALPIAMWLLSVGLGVSAISWLFTSGFGWLCLFFGVALTLFARWTLRRTRASALQTTKTLKSEIRLSPLQAGISAGLLVCVVIPSAVGAAASILVAVCVSAYWPRLQSQSALQLDSVTLRERPWVCAVISGSLLAGHDWVTAVELGFDASTQPESLQLAGVIRRLRWGVDPELAFAQAPLVWRDIAETVGRAHRTGAPISRNLQQVAFQWLQAASEQHILRIERIAGRLIVPVALCQLPAFVLLGVVPLVAAELLPMLHGFTSTSF